MGNDYLWKLAGIGKHGLQRPRLTNIDLEIPRGITALIGRSGSGKSTLINLLSNFEVADEGQLTLGKQMAESSFPFYIVPQDHGLWPHINVRDHLLKVMSRADEERANHLLEGFDILDKALEYPEFLSQGECARLAVARALATQAPVLLMDEPLANVDSARKGDYRDFLLSEVQQQQSSLIFATHAAEEVISCAEQVICLDKGQIIANGQVEEIYYNPPSPQAAALLGPGNWFKQENFAGEQNFCRPEQLHIAENADGEYTVKSSRFFGSYCQTTLESTKGNKTYFHRPSKALSKGAKVILSLLMMLLFFSCDSTDSPELSFSHIDSFNVPAAGHKLPRPRGICYGPNDRIVILDDDGRVLVYNTDGKEIKRWPMPDTGVGNPEGVTVFNDGRIAVADTHYARVVIFDPEGKVLKIFGSRGNKEGQFYSPVGITLDDKENIYVCEYGESDRIQKFTSEGEFILSFGSLGTGLGKLQRASDLVWHKGKIYVADAVNNRIQVFTDEGKFIEVLKNGDQDIPLYLPYDIAIDSKGDFYIVEYGHARVTAIKPDGTLIGHFGSPGSELNQFKTPWGIAIDSNDKIYIADTGNRRITTLKK